MEIPQRAEQSSTSAERRNRFPLQAMFVEVVSIILGIVLALSVNEWRELNAQERRADAALTQIVEEVRSNNELISAIHETNEEILAHLHDSNDSGDEVESRFVPGIQVKNTAWETANSIGVFNHVDYEQILELSDLYSIQDIYRNYGFSLIQALLNGTAVAAANGHPWNESEAIKKFESSLALLVSIEASLLDMYADILEGKTDLLPDAPRDT
ncbi:MAG: hypothetical protein IH853_13610 [Bacteroidetes bacterium]|nr:hypothetical protein [Bacteroidota bacterium]